MVFVSFRNSRWQECSLYDPLIIFFCLLEIQDGCHCMQILAKENILKSFFRPLNHGWNVPWIPLYKIFVFCVSRKTKNANITGHDCSIGRTPLGNYLVQLAKGHPSFYYHLACCPCQLTFEILIFFCKTTEP